MKHADDKDDARWLAHLLRLGIFPTGYNNNTILRTLTASMVLCKRLFYCADSISLVRNKVLVDTSRMRKTRNVIAKAGALFDEIRSVTEHFSSDDYVF